MAQPTKSTATGFIWDAMHGFAIMCSLSSRTLGSLFSNRPWAAKSNANFQHEQKRQLRNEPNKYFVFKRYGYGGDGNSTGFPDQAVLEKGTGPLFSLTSDMVGDDAC